jgi:protein-tyrosine phosphatase
LKGIPPEDHAEIWLVDDEDSNLNVAAVIREAARAVKLLRDEGKTVLLHCVHAHCRTPVVGAAYGALITGDSTKDALDRVLQAIPDTYPRASIVQALLTMNADLSGG